MNDGTALILEERTILNLTSGVFNSFEYRLIERPAADIFLAALQSLNSALDSGKKAVIPNECLVFEDSMAGVEAGRRAGMRVVWVPHQNVAVEYHARQKDVLAGKTRMVEVGDDWQLGEIDDGWAESIPSLEHFSYEKYGINVSS